MLSKKKLDIAKEWERITFTKMTGLHRNEKELQRVLDYQISLTSKARLKK